jgi:hypothetical protein
MPSNPSHLAKILQTHEEDVLREWISLQLAALGRRAGATAEQALKVESREFLTALADALRSEGTTNLQGEKWNAVRDFLGSLSASRAREGFPELASDMDDGEELPAGDSVETSASDRLLAWIFLQPYAEYLAAHRENTIVDGAPSTCPLCGGKPVVGVLRSEGDGAKKSLICMLCAHEWNFRRIYCPACGEEREPQMAFYSAPEIAHVRVDVCDTCHTYLKTIDLTKTGLAVPVVDELATIPLDLWAREHGYQKLQINLLGT